MSDQPPTFIYTYRRVLAGTFFLSFAAIFTAFMLHGLSVAPEYISTAVIQLRASGVAGNTTANQRELKASLELLESDLLARQVALQMTEAERTQFLAPFPPVDRRGPPDIIRLLVMRHWVKSDDAGPPRIDITFEHPDPVVAARMANMFAAGCLELRQQARVRETTQEHGAAFQITSNAMPAHEPYEPKPMLLVSDGLIFGLNLAAAVTFITGAILHLRTRPKPGTQESV